MDKNEEVAKKIEESAKKILTEEFKYCGIAEGDNFHQLNAGNIVVRIKIDI